MSSSRIAFLIDVGVGKKVESHLADHGHDVKPVRSINPSMSDRDMIRLAGAEDRMVITMDKDFGELVHHSGEAHCGVLLLRMEDATGSEKARVVAEIMRRYSDAIQGRFCVYQNGILRVRREGRVSLRLTFEPPEM